MAETAQYMFDLRSLGEYLIRQKGLRAGHWEVGFKLTFVAGNIAAPVKQGTPSGQPQITFPGGIMLIQEVTLSQLPVPTPNSIDASSVSRDDDETSSDKSSDKSPVATLGRQARVDPAIGRMKASGKKRALKARA